MGIERASTKFDFEPSSTWKPGREGHDAMRALEGNQMGEFQDELFTEVDTSESSTYSGSEVARLALEAYIRGLEDGRRQIMVVNGDATCKQAIGVSNV